MSVASPSSAERAEGRRRPRRPGARDASAGYRRIAWLLILLVLIPSGLLLGIGVILVFKGSPDFNLVLGILVLTFCGLLATGATLVWVFIYKEQNLSQLQADFVSKITHELRTPLTSIRLFVETLALKRADPAQTEQCIELLARETDRLSERIDRLLEWGRMEAGRRTYDLREGDVGAVVREAVASFAPAKLQNDVDMTVKIEDDLPPVLLDQPALEMALSNLLTNAYKYGGRPRTISIEVTSDPARACVIVAVSDNGEGIPHVEHKRIFQKFYRRDDRLSRMQEGSGLGLSIVAHVVRGHRGKIHVESYLGRGARFVVQLPALPRVRASSRRAKGD